MGTKFLDEIELYGEELAKEVFHAENADLRPISGHIADWIFLASFTIPGDKVLCVSPEKGGYPGIWKEGLAAILKYKVQELPFSKAKMNVEAEKAIDLVLKVKPKVILFGASLFTFPHPVRETSKAAKEVGALVGYDGSHVLGLIAGGEFQDPLREGASVLLGSTHKSFFGPQGGIILADDEHGEHMKKLVYPTFVDNAHWNRIAALTLALAEMKNFGRDYARQVVRNAQALAKALAEHGFPVTGNHIGYTRSHQVLLDYGNYEEGRKIAQRLEKANIIADCGVRLGTCEVTRRGMKEGEMEKIAELIKRVIIDGEKAERVRRDVLTLVEEFQQVKYCFEI